LTPNRRQPNLEEPSTAIHFQLNLGQALHFADHLSLDWLIYHAKFNVKFGILLGKIHPGSADPGERITPNSGLPNQVCLASVHAGKAKVVLAVETTEEEPMVCHHTEGFSRDYAAEKGRK